MDAKKVTSEKRFLPELAIFRNWFSLCGFVIVMASLFAFLLLLVFDTLLKMSNPYLGIFAYLVMPMFLMAGVAMILGGLLMERVRIKKGGDGATPPVLTVDFTQPKVRRNLLVITFFGMVFLMFASVAGYRGYHFTESVEFCGKVCHTVMKPEYESYLHSPHARIPCAECHIGPGAEWYVKAKISGLYQVYATIFNKFQCPIKTPISNLRPAQETCEQCHWPKKFVGNLDRVYNHFLSDKSNTPYSVRLLLKVGGGDSSHGPVGGIHWHMNVGKKVEYIAKDEQRQEISWVRITDEQHVVTEYQVPGFKPDPEKDIIRRMDCVDCHNRPSHIFQNPSDSLDLAMALGKIDPTMPGIKQFALQVLSTNYTTQAEAMQKIATAIYEKYPADPRYKTAIEVVQNIYRENIFPEMKTNWKIHPNNLGHKDWPGCFRCHDGQHKTADGKQTIKANDCNACHVILAQGAGEQLQNLHAKGVKFDHPGGDFGDSKCNECHPLDAN